MGCLSTLNRLKMNNKQKGDKAEKELFDHYNNKNDCVCIRSPRTMRRIFTPKGAIFISRANDFFGLFDLLVKFENKHANWIQVKTNPNDVYTAKNKIEQFYNKYCSSFEFVSIALRVNRKGWVFYQYIDKTWIKTYYDFNMDFRSSFKITGDK